jgi:hypothetical protein
MPTRRPANLSEDARGKAENSFILYIQHPDAVLLESLNLVVTMYTNCSVSKLVGIGRLAVKAVPLDPVAQFHGGGGGGGGRDEWTDFDRWWWWIRLIWIGG